MSVWMIRAGKQGQHEQFCLDNGLIGPGWHEVPDLSATRTREDIKAIVEDVYSGSNASVANYTGQLWRLRHGVQPDDLVVLPLKTSSQVAIGKVTGTYRYDDTADLYRRHTIPVEWIVTDIPRTAIRQDLLFSLGSAMTVCALNRNDAERRITQLLATGTDPGARVTPTPLTGSTNQPFPAGSVDDSPDSIDLDVERYALDQLTTFIGEKFAGYAMQTLVAAILEAEGYHTEVPPEGADDGIDVVAGSGPLGLDSPRLVAQVKSGTSAVDAPTVQQLQGAITTHGADHGLLVAWGGLTKPAQQAVRSQRFRVRVWDADDLIEALTRTYDRLPGEIQAQIPLTQVWVLLDGGEQ